MTEVVMICLLCVVYGRPYIQNTFTHQKQEIHKHRKSTSNESDWTRGVTIFAAFQPFVQSCDRRVKLTARVK